MKREELLKDPTYWTSKLQIELYNQIIEFMEKNKMNKRQLAEYLGCSKSYITQLLSGDYDHKISKFVELTLSIGKIPSITFKDIDEFIKNDYEYVSSKTTNTEQFTVVYPSIYTFEKISA